MVKFFQTPTALERKRMEMVKKDYTEGKIKPGSAAVINYINEGLPMLPGELGLRLLKSVKVCGDKV
jgi:ribosomal protein L7Ae-like RNA K-turn-binding protein